MNAGDRTTVRGAYDRAVKAWAPPATRKACGRNPAAGPGSCTFWWEGCPKAEDRGCFQAHLRAWAQGTRRGARP